MRVLDLFSGIGGFSLGLERAGMKTVAFCEIDKFGDYPGLDRNKFGTLSWLGQAGALFLCLVFVLLFAGHAFAYGRGLVGVEDVDRKVPLCFACRGHVVASLGNKQQGESRCVGGVGFISIHDAQIHPDRDLPHTIEHKFISGRLHQTVRARMPFLHSVGKEQTAAERRLSPSAFRATNVSPQSAPQERRKLTCVDEGVFGYYRLNKQPTGYCLNIFCDGTPSISEFPDNGNMRTALVERERSWRHDAIVEHYPRAILGFHFGELALGGVKLALYRASSLGGFVPSLIREDRQGDSGAGNDDVWQFLKETAYGSPLSCFAIAFTCWIAGFGCLYGARMRRWLVIPGGALLVIAPAVIWFLYQSTPPHRFAENVIVLAVVVPETELGDVERQILLADFVERAHHAALNQGPEAFDGIGVDRARNILARVVLDEEMRVLGGKFGIAGEVVSRQQADLVRDDFADEFLQRRALHVVENASDDIALALHRANHSRLAMRAARTTATSSLAAAMPVLVLAANVGLIDFDDPDELAEVFILHRGAQPMTHVPSGFVRAETHRAMDLESADALLARHHHVQDAEPVAQGLIGILEHCPGDMGEAVAVIRARLALPMPRAAFEFVDVGVAAAGADSTARPAIAYQVGTARIFVGESRFPFPDGHLMNALSFRHGRLTPHYGARMPC